MGQKQIPDLWFRMFVEWMRACRSIERVKVPAVDLFNPQPQAPVRYVRRRLRRLLE